MSLSDLRFNLGCASMGLRVVRGETDFAIFPETISDAAAWERQALAVLACQEPVVLADKPTDNPATTPMHPDAGSAGFTLTRV